MRHNINISLIHDHIYLQTVFFLNVLRCNYVLLNEVCLDNPLKIIIDIHMNVYVIIYI